MRSNDEILESINSLRSQLGMEPKSEQQVPVEDSSDVSARIAALNQKLASTPISRREFIEKRAADAAKSNTQTVFEFGEGVLEGIGMLAKQGKDAAVEAFNEMSDGEVSMYGFGRGLADTLNIGGRDFYRFAKTLGEAAMDKLGGYTEEEEIEREYKRYLDNFNYNTVVREKMLDQVENRAMVDFGANFVDPFMVFPVAKLATFAAKVPLKVAQKTATTAAFAARSKGAVNVAKFAKGAGKAVKAVDKIVDFAGHKLSLPTELAARVGAMGTRAVLKGGAYTTGVGLKGVGMAGSAVETVASLPRKGIAKVAEKVTGATGKGPGTAALTGQVTGAVAGVPGFFELGIAEGIGVLAKKMGKGLGEVATTFAQKGSNKRFLYRLATSDKVSEATRRKAMWAYNHFGTSVGDAAFNMLANGLSLGAINAGLSGLTGEDAKTSGAAFGSGALAGGFIPAGQRGMQGGKRDSAREQAGIDKYMKDKLGMDQRKLFQQLPKAAQVLISTLQESGIGAPGIRLLDSETYLQFLNNERAKKNIAPLTRAPAGHFATQEGVVYLNSDTINQAGDTGVEFVAHEVGHDFIHKSLGNDPAMLELILERYKTTAEDPNGTAFYYQFDSKGNGIGDPIYLNKEATQVATDYSRKQAGIGVGRDASKLAQEIGADQFSMAFSKDPNIFEHIHPRLRRYLIDGARRVLTGGAMLEPSTGNPLTNTISRQMQQNPAIKRLFTNYAKMRAFELDEKANLAKEGILIEPKKGQQGSDRYVELFGGIGLNLKDAKNLVVTNKGLLRELIRMRDQWKEEPSDGWSVRRGQLEGKTLTNDLRTLFTRSDQWGNVANIIDALQQAIDQRIGIRFGYRSGTRGKYQNPFRLRDVAIYGWQVGPMGGKGRASLKVLGYDQAVVRQNVQVLVDKGYIQNPDKFMQQLAEQGQAALADPEGRINPEGRRENELMTVAFGLKESSGQVASPGLRELLESKAVNKSFRSYDVEALAGLTKGESKAFAFNYDNIRDNYNPFRQSDDNFFQPAAYHGTPHTFAAEPGAPFGRFRTSAIGTGEGAQAYGHGLYFAGKTDVADFYRQTLTQDQMFNDLDLRVTLNMRNFINMFRKNKNDVDFMRKHANRIKDDVSEQDFSELTRYIDHVEKNGHPKETGSLYKVELAPKENEYLLYDKTLGEQTKDIQNKVRKVLTELEGEDLWEYRKDLDYRDITQNALENIPEPEISRRLKEAGIPGIKYLDGSSRSKGEGDYNYVIFDEADVQITDKLFMPAEDVMTAVNVRNELNNKFADLIVSGQKSIETRRTRSLDPLVGQRVKILRTTGKGDEARIVGEVTIGEPIEYKTKTEFAKDYNKHLVDDDSDFTFQDGGKFGYPMLNPERYDTPYPMPKRKGIVYTKEVSGPNQLFMPALEDVKALVEQRGRVAEAAEETFFGKMLPKMLRKVGGGLKPSSRNIREASRRAIEDTEVFLKENPQFADYYKADMAKVRTLLDDAYNTITDDEMLYYRLALGLTSPGTSLPANVGDGLNIFNLRKQDGNLDRIKLGESAKGNVVITESPFQVSGTTAPTKARALKIVDRLDKEKGGIRKAVAFLEEGVTMKELHQFNKAMGYKGNVAKTGDIKRIVKAATGQDEMIPRMFIFGPKVGAYTLNAIGRHNYNTIDVWEARFIRSYFKGMFSKNTGLPANVDEHSLMTRFTELFQEEYNQKTGQNLETSALQALRWFYMIDTAKKLGYTGASTNETISGYTERYISRLGLNKRGRGQGDGTIDGRVSTESRPSDQQFFPQSRQTNRVATRGVVPQASNRFMMPTAARAAVAQGETLERIRN